MNKELTKQMYKAIENEDWKSMNAIMQSKDFNINEETIRGSFLQIAIDEGKDDMAICLIEKGIDIDFIDDITGSSALTDAVLHNNKKMVEALCEKGAKLDVSKANNNPLFFAISGHKPEIAKVLIDAGIDFYKTYEVGEIENCDACEWAKKWGTIEVYNYIKEKEIADGKKFEIELKKNSFEALYKIVNDKNDLYEEDGKIFCSAKARRLLIEANVKGISFEEIDVC